MASESESPTVTVNGCTIVGTTQPASDDYPKAIDIFHGISYATAKRFQPAVPTPPEASQKIDASTPAPSQPFPLAPHATAENPLTLNIFRPSSSSSSGAESSSLPVVVYVHGGAFNFGFPLERDMASFVTWGKRDVIVVSITYRLGALGFLVGGFEAKELNLGLKDQRLAVEWVKEWIGAFGGDGDNVTLMGVSAGAHSIGHHILNPSPLPFRKAILESGSPTARSVLSPSHPRVITQYQRLKMYTNNRLLETLPIDPLLEGAVMVWAEHATSVTWPFQPVIDGPGGIIPDLPLNLLDDLVQSGRAKDLSIITGFCSHEGTQFAPQNASTSAEFRSFFSKLIPSLSADDLDALELLYPDPLIHPDSPYRQPPGIGGPEKRAYGAQFRRIHTAYAHYAYICPVLHTAHTLSRAGATVYLYEYAALADPFRAASHGDQAPTVAHDMDVLRSSPGMIDVAKEMNSRWISFSASPDGKLNNSDKNEAWPTFTSPFNDDGTTSTASGVGELLVFGEGNNEDAGGKDKGTPVKTRTLTPVELEQCRFWWERMELSQGMGDRGAALVRSREGHEVEV